jgi:hypothetical protein
LWGWIVGIGMVGSCGGGGGGEMMRCRFTVGDTGVNVDR